MNSRIKTVLLLLACTLTSIAQTAYKGQFFVSNERFTIQGSLLRVEMRVSYDDDVLNPGEELNFTPVLKSGYHSQALSSVVVNGRERSNYEKRKDELQVRRHRQNIPLVVRDKRHGTHYFIYDTTIPYSEWMHDASLYIECEERGWNGKPHVYEDKLYEKLRFSVSPESSYDPIKKGNFAEGKGTAARTEWVQFLDPSVGSNSELTITGYIPLCDERNIGKLSGRKFNETVFNEMQTLLDTQLQIPGTTVKSMAIVGYGAPIGNYKKNEVVSAARALELKEYLMRNQAIGANALTVTWVPEDWDSIYVQVGKSSMKLKAAAMDIIRSVDVVRGREDELRMLGDGVPYSYMKNYIFPNVCRIKYTAVLQRTGLDAASGHLLLHNRPESMSLNDLYAMAGNFSVGSREFNDIVDLSARLFPDNAEANIDAAGVALLRGNLDDAEKYLMGWKTDSRAYNNMGVFYMLKRDYAKAEVYLQMAQAGGVPEASKALDYLHHIGK